jgi:hypothetical protein
MVTERLLSGLLIALGITAIVIGTSIFFMGAANTGHVTEALYNYLIARPAFRSRRRLLRFQSKGLQELASKPQPAYLPAASLPLEIYPVLSDRCAICFASRMKIVSLAISRGELPTDASAAARLRKTWSACHGREDHQKPSLAANRVWAYSLSIDHFERDGL